MDEPLNKNNLSYVDLQCGLLSVFLLDSTISRVLSPKVVFHDRQSFCQRFKCTCHKQEFLKHILDITGPYCLYLSLFFLLRGRGGWCCLLVCFVLFCRLLLFSIQQAKDVQLFPCMQEFWGKFQQIIPHQLFFNKKF